MAIDEKIRAIFPTRVMRLAQTSKRNLPVRAFLPRERSDKVQFSTLSTNLS